MEVAHGRSRNHAQDIPTGFASVPPPILHARHVAEAPEMLDVVGLNFQAVLCGQRTV
jgi:hypothetical protein